MEGMGGLSYEDKLYRQGLHHLDLMNEKRLDWNELDPKELAGWMRRGHFLL